jgi:hypothetical protein
MFVFRLSAFQLLADMETSSHETIHVHYPPSQSDEALHKHVMPTLISTPHLEPMSPAAANLSNVHQAKGAIYGNF